MNNYATHSLKILLAKWSADFSIYKTLKIENERSNKLTSLISSSNLGSEEMPIEEYVQLVG